MDKGEMETELCKRLFLCFQIPLTTACVTSFRSTDGELLLFPQVHVRRSVHEVKLGRLVPILAKTSSQIVELKSQDNIRWSLDSVSDEHKTHKGDTCKPQETNLDLTGRRSRVVIHIVKFTGDYETEIQLNYLKTE
ncbi:unnamed protein product [Microthlaspi erraticum]|uniref:Uncharacterized protein n=1 Tax=Microthlaspi erraticum TaxID=1685480 RepID=A0A6D2HN60_9BRAS|nr:unnamed protein product [Microthlaspi erraticum]CAA7055878.1 unnamed protein product [Microthlaspi erraticum]